MIRQDTMEQIIRSQQEQIAGLLETNRSLVESTYSGAYPFTFRQLIKHKNSL